LFKFNVEEELSCKIEGTGKFIAKKGAMVAFKGNFNQPNQMVLVQPSERLSGLKISVD